jgi:RNA polymerase sigma factor (sigma-70 family)
VEGENLTDSFGLSLGGIFERQNATAKRVALKMLDESAAEDVASETMIRVAARLNQGLTAQEAEALVPIIAYGLAVDEYRRQEIPAGLGHVDDWLGSLIEEESLAVNEALTVDRDAFAAAFDNGVRGLNEEDFTAFTLTDLRGLPEREAADVLGTSQKTINRRRESARHILRGAIAA